MATRRRGGARPARDAWRLEPALAAYGVLPAEEGAVLPEPKQTQRKPRPRPGTDRIAEGLCAKCGRLVHRRRHRCYGCGEPTKTLHRVVGFAAGRTEAPFGLDRIPGILRGFEHNLDACTRGPRYQRLTPFRATPESARMAAVRARRLGAEEAAVDAEVAQIAQAELQARRADRARPASPHRAGEAATLHVRTVGPGVQDCRSTPTPV